MRPPRRRNRCRALSRRRAIKEFAKASIVGLVAHQLGRSHPELVPDAVGSLDTIRHSTVPAELKRDLLERIWRERGPEILLSIGQGIRHAQHDPLWSAALRTPNPDVLLDKWRRFEVFGHSKNRLRIERVGEKRYAFHRYTADGGTPGVPENLLVCGLVIGLLEEIGCDGLRCEMTRDRGAPVCIRKDGQFLLPGDAEALTADSWTIEWTDFEPRAAAVPSETEFVKLDLPSTCGPREKAWLERVTGLMSFDAARQWEVGELAREVGVSKRTLQRRLGDAGLSFSQLVRLVRIKEASRLLERSDASITAIGFCAGFSDSAHFSRDFRASTGLTPSAYRHLLQAAPA